MIRICTTGKNPTMRYLGLTHGISIAWLHERCSEDCVNLVHCPTSEQAAGIFTKTFEDATKWQPLLSLVDVINPATFFSSASSSSASMGTPAAVSVQCTPPSFHPSFFAVPSAAVLSPWTFAELFGGPRSPLSARCHARGGAAVTRVLETFNVRDPREKAQAIKAVSGSSVVMWATMTNPSRTKWKWDKHQTSNWQTFTLLAE